MPINHKFLRSSTDVWFSVIKSPKLRKNNLAGVDEHR
jgi:hypothetical protein